MCSIMVVFVVLENCTGDYVTSKSIMKECVIGLYHFTSSNNSEMGRWISSINLLAAVYSKEEEVRYRFWHPRRTDKPPVGSIIRMVCKVWLYSQWKKHTNCTSCLLIIDGGTTTIGNVCSCANKMNELVVISLVVLSMIHCVGLSRSY